MSQKNSHPKMLTFLLAGGQGKRLGPMTDNRCKPAVPYTQYNIISFAISNIINSKRVIDHTHVLTQYKQTDLIDMITALRLETSWDQYIRVLPPQQNDGHGWYEATANAVFQNYELIESDNAQYVLILAGDHIYKMDYEDLLDDHIKNGADVTISGMFMPPEESSEFGVMELDENGRVTHFIEKPRKPEQYAYNKLCSVSQGIYIFPKDLLTQLLKEDHDDIRSTHDFGKDIIPKMIRNNMKVFFYNHTNSVTPGENGPAYWRDVGTIDAYYDAAIDQTKIKPLLDLYNKEWPIKTIGDSPPMAKINFLSDDCQQILLGLGVVLTKPAIIRHSILSQEVRLEEGSVVIDSILFKVSSVGRNSRIIRTIVEEGLPIPDGCIIGEDAKFDRSRNIKITEQGVRVVHSGSKL